MFKGKTRSPINVILLSLFTCSIYLFYWNYTTATEVNAALGKEAVTPLFAILGLICPPLIWLHMYKMDKAMMELNQANGKPYESRFILWLILSFFGVGLIVYEYQVQADLNDIWAKR